MSWADEALDLLARAAARRPPPRVRALHLPPPEAAASKNGEFCALELDDGALGLSYVLLGDFVAFDFSPYPNIQAWIARMKARPSFLSAYAAFETFVGFVRGQAQAA